MTRFANPAEFHPAERTISPLGMGEITRRLASGDTQAFTAHLLRLDARGRRLRFGSPVNAAFVERYAATALGAHDRDATTDIVGLFSDGVLRGAAELFRLPGDGSEAEAAFSLEAGLRGRGLGTRLFDDVLRAARKAGIRALSVHFLRENVAMRKIVARHSPKIAVEGSEMTATIALGAAPRPVPAAVSRLEPA